MAESKGKKIRGQILYAITIIIMFVVAWYLMRGTTVMSVWVGGILAVFGLLTLVDYLRNELKAILSPEKDFWKVTVGGIGKLVIGIVSIVFGIMLLGSIYSQVLGITALVIGLLGVASWLANWKI